jgi:ring-1,2-phenylacetyl-CoA epoxidase subunit PaaC
MAVQNKNNKEIFEYLLRLADDRLIIGHRLSEWCGHGPIVEEDIALANIALDCIGQATNLLKLAGEVEGEERNEDDLAYFREAIDFRNLILAELPKGDFAFTIARQFLFSAYSYLLLPKLTESKFEPLAAQAAKALKENQYHLRHSSEWMLRLGDGTEESHRRVQKAVDDLWMYTGEMFEEDDLQQKLVNEGIVVNSTELKPEWKEMVADVISQATLKLPDDDIYMMSGGRFGRHSEHLGHLLSEMQILARSFPGAKW